MPSIRHALRAGIGVAALFAAVTQTPRARDCDSASSLSWYDPVEPDFEDSERFASIKERSGKKTYLVEELVAGRRSLCEVAREFEALDRTAQHYSALYQGNRADQTLDERAALVVLGYLPLRELPAGERNRVVERLRTEFRDRYGLDCLGEFGDGKRPSVGSVADPKS